MLRFFNIKGFWFISSIADNQFFHSSIIVYNIPFHLSTPNIVFSDSLKIIGFKNCLAIPGHAFGLE